MKRPEIVTAAEIRSLFERAVGRLDALDDENDDDVDPDDERSFLAWRRARGQSMGLALEAMRFCAAAAHELADPALADVVIDAVEQLGAYEGYAATHHNVAGAALSAVLRAGLKVDARVRALAADSHVFVREAVADGLRPAGDAERELLEALMNDPAVSVRQAAKASMEAVMQVPWWTGKWKSDPAARLLPEELDACSPALRAASELLDQPAYAFHDATKILALCEQLAKLPAALAIEPAEQILRGHDRYNLGPLLPALVLVLERDGGVEAFDRLVEEWGRHPTSLMHQRTLGPLVQERPREIRLAVCRRCIERMLAAPMEERFGLSSSPATMAASIAGQAWPPDEDITPILDALLEGGEPVFEDPDGFHRDFARWELGGALTLEGVDPTPVLGRLVEARLAGYPGPWKGIGRRADVLLGRAPREVLRRTAEQALLSSDAATIAWGEGVLLGDAHDPALDGSLAERAAAFVAEPRLRDALFQSRDLTQRALPALRAELRRGTFAYGQAVEIFEVIASLHGGLARPPARPPLPGSTTKPPDPEEQRRAMCEQLAPFLGPPELSGPPTEEDWAALRRARAASTGDDPEQHALRWMRTLSEGPWTEEERAILAEYVARFRDGEVDTFDYAIGTAIAVKPDASLMPLFDEVVRKSGPDTRGLLRRMRAQTRAFLGIQPPPDAAAASAGGGPGAAPDDDGDEWGDDEEDGEA